MEPSSSSKVTVEYFDPSGVFPLISPGLLSRLPLRNLHWKSPSRPLRSISSLHVDLVPRVKSSDSSHSVDESAGRRQSRGQGREEQKTIPDAGAGTFKGPIKERRHQIPGLRQTPYLKLYLLRCDDGETYKASSRKLLREWIKEHTPPASASHNTQEKHDAFEWLIVHVVLPNTSAAAQPRHSGSSAAGATNAPDRPSSSSRWPGRGTSTILEKIRSDFNGSSKTSLDRIAQVRLHKTDIPPHLLPDSHASGASAYNDGHNEGQQEQEAAWSDLVMKFKSLILTSFDSRVGRYEEDIRERDAQRSLPGWNFCTFFVLKEGLARGFESVGLVEDALIGYDELAEGLDDIVRVQATEEEGKGHGGAFLKYTEDLRRQAEEARRSAIGDERAGSDGEDSEDAGPAALPLSATKKRYRDLVLSNNISVFDFRCYVFARQMSLLLRLGNAWSSRAELMAKLRVHPGTEHTDTHEGAASASRARSTTTEDPEDLMVLAEVCARGTEFITSLARVMRLDLRHSYRLTADEVDADEDEDISRVIDNIVSSWSFSVSQQILAETSTRALPIPPSSLAESNPSTTKVAAHGGKGHEPKTAIPEPKTMMHPARTSSLHINPGTAHGVPPAQPSPNVFPGGAAAGRELQRPGEPSGASQRSTFLKAGIEDLAANRAELYLLSRKVLDHFGEQHGWLRASESLKDGLERTDLEDVDLSADGSTAGASRGEGDGRQARSAPDTRGISHKLLRSALEDKQGFYNLYEILSDKVMRHYTVAGRTKSVERIMCDLATLKYDLEDYATAATYFGRLVPYYSETGWDLVEDSMLKRYAACLKKLDRPEDYVRVIIELLAKAASREMRGGLGRSRRGREGNDNDPNRLLDESASSVDGYLSDLLVYSKELPQRVTVPLQRVFGDAFVSPYPQHLDDRDGFKLQVGLRNLLGKEIKIGSVKVRIVGTTSAQGREIWLESNGPLTLERGPVRVWVKTNTVIPGSYTVDKILLEAPNITFIFEAGSRSSASALAGSSFSATPSGAASIKEQRIVYFPRPENLEAKLALSRRIRLDEARSIEVSLSTGWNEMIKGELRVRSASGGLRLRTADAEVHELAEDAWKQAGPGVYELGRVSSHSTPRFSIPYALERDLPELSIKIEVVYTTVNGEFVYSTNANVGISLPLGVNVQEIFKQKALFSRFTVSTATAIPLRVLGASLRGPNRCQVESWGPPQHHMMVFPRQPASLLYKVTPAGRRPSPATGAPMKGVLTLGVDYSCLDEEVGLGLESAFLTALEGSPHRWLSRLLLPRLLSRARDGLSTDEYEAIGISGEIHVRAYADMGWAETLKVLPRTDREAVEAWLKQWHRGHTVVRLPRAGETGQNRCIIIPVELPHVQVVHTADLRLADLGGGRDEGHVMASVGQMLVAELQIRHTRTWDSEEASAARDSPPADARFDFVYEIQANADHWLVGGQRRVHFSAGENEMRKFPVMLMPLRPGHLLLPGLEISPADGGQRVAGGEEAASSKGESHRATASLTTIGPDGAASQKADRARRESTKGVTKGAPRITCETDYRNQAQAVLVVPAVECTTVSLDGPTNGGARSSEAERRWSGPGG
ncbi:MAG: hypothetical protein M1832_003875 [Thelocarpon impressellum]|nr:MAG: hypothetical protein M1832_003875 [Thelocarpon impressellum]